MADQALRNTIRDLFVETGRAHHEAFVATDGEDPDWPIWYADHTRERLNELLDTELTRSRLIYCLMFVDFERQARDPDAEWAGYYADHLVERFAPATAPAEDKLALYYFPSCPFCIMVRRTIDALGIDVELRDIHANAEYREELLAARGRTTVPVLRIKSANGEERFMPESHDIVHYLEQTYSKAA